MDIYKQRSKTESYITTYYSHILQSVPAQVRDHVGSDLAAKWGVGNQKTEAEGGEELPT